LGTGGTNNWDGGVLERSKRKGGRLRKRRGRTRITLFMVLEKGAYRVLEARWKGFREEIYIRLLSRLASFFSGKRREAVSSGRDMVWWRKTDGRGTHWTTTGIA